VYALAYECNDYFDRLWTRLAILYHVIVLAGAILIHAQQITVPAVVGAGTGGYSSFLALIAFPATYRVWERLCQLKTPIGDGPLMDQYSEPQASSRRLSQPLI